MTLNETLRRFEYPFTATEGQGYGEVLDNQGRLVSSHPTLSHAMTEAYDLNQAVLARRPAPVAAEDHAFVGDGYDDASICVCGRYREDHLRH